MKKRIYETENPLLFKMFIQKEALPEASRNVKVLLAGLEEQFDPPSFPVELRDELRGMLLHVCEDFDGLPRLRVN